MQYSGYQKKIFKRIRESDRNIVIDAVAGSGKSTTLFKIASIVSEFDEPQSVLFFAFNNHIAKFAQDKLGKCKNVKVVTTHAYGLSCIKKSKDFKSSEMNTAKVWAHIEANVSNYRMRGLFYNALTTLRTFGCMSYTDTGINKFVKRNPSILNQIGDSKIFTYSATIGRMMEALDKEKHHYDFDDMLRFPLLYDLLKYGEKTDMLLVDEAQDLNVYQFAFVEHFIDDDTRIVAVGDDNQAIYSFRGACGDALDTIKEMCNARRMPLSITYRCKSRIVDFVLKQYEKLDYEPPIEAFAQGGHVYEYVGSKEDEYNLETLLKNNVDMIVSAKNKHIISIWFYLLERYNISSSLKGSKITTMLTKMFKGFKSSNIPFSMIWSELEKQMTSTDEGIADMAASGMRFIRLLNVKDYEAIFKKIKEIENDTKAKIHLHTVHSAKGLEAEKVFVINDWFDSDQKQNMMYVAYTRASNELYVITPPKEPYVKPKDKGVVFGTKGKLA